MIAFGFGFIVPLSVTICCYAIVAIVLLDLFLELYLMNQLGIESPTLRNKQIIIEEDKQDSTLFDSLKVILESWLLFFKSKMNVPGIALGALYLNALALSPMLEGSFIIQNYVILHLFYGRNINWVRICQTVMRERIIN